MAGDEAASGQMQQIDLTKLPLVQLNHLKQQLDQDLSLYQESLQTLKGAQNKFQDSADCVDRLENAKSGSPILLPLTGSMYVPGKLLQPDVTLVDVGTGYFAEKNIKEAKEYFQRKVKFVTEQMEKIQAIGFEKSRVRDDIVEVMEAKVQAQGQGQQA
uniref:EOG090X0NBB n=1 Tax=Lynceus sp. MCZ IZ 141354 TaxID=1930659 RepID=A0A9N6WWF9_9CRUS|nr:EOG090X0NBB [Lynceus sp. MCZ IZ 141354]